MKDEVLPKTEAMRWILQAESDLGVARLALREGFYSISCFFSQQSGEKAFKSIGYFRGDRRVFGNSLQKILDNLTETYPDLSNLRDSACRLDQYYLSTRYPDALP